MNLTDGKARALLVAVAILAGIAALGPRLGAAQQEPPPGERARAMALERDAEARLEALRLESENLATRADSLIGEVGRLEDERQRTTEQLATLGEQVARTEQVLTETSEQITNLEAELAAQRPAVKARLIETYKLGRARYARMLLSVNDLQTLGRAYRMVTELARLDHQRVAEYQATLEALGSTRQALEDRQEEQQRLRANARAARRKLDAAIAEQTALMRRIAERRDLNEQFTQELHRSQQLLQATLAAMAGNAPAGKVPPALPLRPFQGALPWPAEGTVQRASNEPGPETGTMIVRDGIEILATQGVAVHAVHQGRVAFAGRFTGFGNLAIIDHGNETYSVYGYLSVLAAQRGAFVDRGQILGSVGRSPTGTPALYFELRVDGTTVDPLEWLEEKTTP